MVDFEDFAIDPDAAQLASSGAKQYLPNDVLENAALDMARRLDEYVPPREFEAVAVALLAALQQSGWRLLRPVASAPHD